MTRENVCRTLMTVGLALALGVGLAACSHAPARRKTGFTFIPTPSSSQPTRSTGSRPGSSSSTPPATTVPPGQTSPTSSQGPLYGMPLLEHVPFTMDGIAVRTSGGVTSSGKTVLFVLSKLPYAQASAAWTAVCAHFHDPCTEYQPVFRGGGEIG